MTYGAVVLKNLRSLDGHAPKSSSYPASELPAREQPTEESGTEVALTIVLAGA